jgi:hypothetical protein
MEILGGTSTVYCTSLAFPLVNAMEVKPYFGTSHRAARVRGNYYIKNRCLIFQLISVTYTWSAHIQRLQSECRCPLWRLGTIGAYYAYPAAMRPWIWQRALHCRKLSESILSVGNVQHQKCQQPSNNAVQEHTTNQMETQEICLEYCYNTM